MSTPWLTLWDDDDIVCTKHDVLTKVVASAYLAEVELVDHLAAVFAPDHLDVAVFGERRQSARQRNRLQHIDVSSYGELARIFDLPGDINPHALETHHRDGY